MDPEVLLGNAALEQIAKHVPKSEDALVEHADQLKGWRKSYLAKAVLETLKAE